MDNKFIRYIGALEKGEKKKVKKISFKVKLSNVEGTFNITDIMLQQSNYATGYTIHTKEMLQKTSTVKHYNILIRGKNNGIIVNNDGNTTTGLSYIISPSTNTSGPITIKTLNKTLEFTIKDKIKSRKKLIVDSFNYTLTNDGLVNRNYRGGFLSIPAVFGSYNIDMSNRDMANFVFKIHEHNKKDRF